jgi:hypothetical protein
MQKLIRRFLIIFGLTTLGLIFSEGKSSAQYSGTATLSVNQSVATDCNFGSLNYSNNTGVIAKTGVYPASITWDGTFLVTCNTGTKVQISTSVPSLTGSVPIARSLSTYDGEYLTVGGVRIWGSGNYSSVSTASLTPGSIAYRVFIGLKPGTTGPGIPSGSYGYTFILTATPN